MAGSPPVHRESAVSDNVPESLPPCGSTRDRAICFVCRDRVNGGGPWWSTRAVVPPASSGDAAGRGVMVSGVKGRADMVGSFPRVGRMIQGGKWGRDGETKRLSGRGCAAWGWDRCSKRTDLSTPRSVAPGSCHPACLIGPPADLPRGGRAASRDRATRPTCPQDESICPLRLAPAEHRECGPRTKK